nr:hypothetical protein [Armatimonas sp.]
MAIEHFERPFTDEEWAELAQQISRLEESEEKNHVDILEPVLLWFETFLDSLASWFLVPVLVLGFTAWFGLGVGVLAGLALIMLRIAYPRQFKVRRQDRERDEKAHVRRVSMLRAAQAEGVIHSVRITTDAFVELSGNDIFAGEYLAGFCRIAENRWLLLAPVEDWHSEIVLSWHAGRWPNWVSSVGEELTPIAECDWIELLADDRINHGDLFELSLDELLTATPELLESTRRGNLFSSPGR